MRLLVLAILGTILLAEWLTAGQIFGSVTSGGRPVPRAAIVIDCRGEGAGGATAGDGSYRIPVSQQGRCILRLKDYAGAEAVVFSYPNPAQYDFELVRQNDGRFAL